MEEPDHSCPRSGGIETSPSRRSTRRAPATREIGAFDPSPFSRYQAAGRQKRRPGEVARSSSTDRSADEKRRVLSLPGHIGCRKCGKLPAKEVVHDDSLDLPTFCAGAAADR